MLSCHQSQQLHLSGYFIIKVILIPFHWKASTMKNNLRNNSLHSKTTTVLLVIIYFIFFFLCTVSFFFRTHPLRYLRFCRENSKMLLKRFSSCHATVLTELNPHYTSHILCVCLPGGVHCWEETLKSCDGLPEAPTRQALRHVLPRGPPCATD